MFESVKVVLVIISIFILIQAWKNISNKYLLFVIGALWLRYTLSAFHEDTYDPIIAGFSINALGSIFVVALGLLIIPKISFLLRHYFVFYCFFAIIVLSGLINAEYKGLINVLVKWGYFFVLSAALFVALRMLPTKQVFKGLLVPFFLPVSLQILSIVLGEVKATENDGSASYVGGYNHEAAFSMIIVGSILVLSWLERNTIKLHSFIFFGMVFLLILVNYRTSMLAVLPLIFIFVITILTERFESKYRPIILGLAAFPIVMVGLFISSTLAERFSDISLVLNSLDSLIKPPSYFTDAEQDLFSARVYLWSQYLTAFVQSDLLHKMFGFGPESWSEVFPKHAHNTFVSYIYEYGYIGTTTFLIVNIYLLKQALNNQSKILGRKLFFSILGLMIMSLSTMPLWNIEGLICYALIAGTIFAKGDQLAKA
jgi:O-antigen ligase